MDPRAESLAAALRSFGGAAHADQLLGAGIAKRSLASAVAQGSILRPARGLYALPEAPFDVVQARSQHAYLSCASAAGHYGLWLLRPPDRLHLTARHRRLPSDFVDHRWQGSSIPGRLPYPPLPDVLVHAMGCLPFLDALVLVESAAGTGRVDLNALRSRLPGNRNSPARSVLDAVEPGADSLLETLARLLFRRAGFHTEAQVYLQGIGWVDFLLEGFLVVEIDGGTHLERAQFKKDKRRDNRSIRDGYLVLRYLYEDVVVDPQPMLDEIRQVLSGRPVLPLRTPGPPAPDARSSRSGRPVLPLRRPVPHHIELP